MLIIIVDKKETHNLYIIINLNLLGYLQVYLLL